MTYPNPPEQQPAYPPAPGYGAPAQQGPLRGRTPRRLGWIFLIVAVALFVIGGVVAATKSLNKVDDFQRVSFAEGSGTVNLDDTGKWVGYYEASNVSDSIDAIPRIRVLVTSPSGKNVPLQNYGNRSDGKIKKFTYHYHGHRGAGAFQFHVSEAGRYTVEIQAVDQLPSGADIAIGRDISGGAVVGGLLIIGGVLFLVAAIVLLIVGYVKRSRHKRERQSLPVGGGPSGYAPPPPGYGGQGYGGQGYGAPPPGYNPQQGYNAPPPGYGSPPPPGYNPPPPGYNPPPSQGQEDPGFGRPPEQS